MKNERSTKRKSAKLTSAANLEEKFDAGESVLDYFDTSQAARPNQHGGTRPGAGRKPQGHVRLQVYVAAHVKEKAKKHAELENTSLSAVVEKALLRLGD